MDLIVNRNDHRRTRIIDEEALPLDARQARLRVDHFGLSANNFSLTLA